MAEASKEIKTKAFSRYYQLKFENLLES